MRQFPSERVARNGNAEKNWDEKLYQARMYPSKHGGVYNSKKSTKIKATEKVSAFYIKLAFSYNLYNFLKHLRFTVSV